MGLLNKPIKGAHIHLSDVSVKHGLGHTHVVSMGEAMNRVGKLKVRGVEK
jgi:hypothetical protein